MSRLNILDDIKTAAPCQTSWDDMVGEGRARFCDSCGLHVYEAAGLDGAEVVELIKGREGRLCAKLYRRTDGTIVTRNCPRGVARRRKRRFRVAALFALFLGGALWAAHTLDGPEPPPPTPTTQVQQSFPSDYDPSPPIGENL